MQDQQEKEISHPQSYQGGKTIPYVPSKYTLYLTFSPFGWWNNENQLSTSRDSQQIACKMNIGDQRQLVQSVPKGKGSYIKN